MSKKKLIVIIAAILVALVVVAVIIRNVKDNPETEAKETATTAATTIADVTVEKETTPELTEAELTEETTKEKSTVKKTGYAPDKKKDTCELLYKKEHIVGVEVRLWGTYFKEIKGTDAIVRFSAKYETITKGEDENGTYTDHMKEGYDYHFNLKTKKGYREDWSIGKSEYDNGIPRWTSDGFPEKQRDYDAVEIRYEQDCVVLTLFFDKPLVQSNVDAEFTVLVEENIFRTEFGIGNYEYRDSWFRHSGEE